LAKPGDGYLVVVVEFSSRIVRAEFGVEIADPIGVNFINVKRTHFS